MTHELTRRNFGLLSLAAVTVILPKISLAQTIGYSNLALLEEPSSLIGAVSPMAGSGQSAQIEGMLLVDVRPREEFDAGHVPGAVHLDPNAVVARQSPIDGTLMGIADLEALLGDIGVAANRRIVVYDDRGGFHAARMLWLMEYLGHRNVAVLNGGWSGWQEADGPVATYGDPVIPAVFQSALSPRRHATAADVLAHRERPDAVLIDVRPTHMYDEGHVPWAVNVPWAQNLGEDGRFRPADHLLAHFEQHGVTPEHDVIMHCQFGLASSHSYVALRLLGFPRVRVYHRSWAEWGSDPELPKVTS
ncbi:MAG: sulfurtransferase [Pseudomonadota bacterium]